ncbi:hypothetical protein NS263_03520 [Curtobacterium oceanosedimentum]|uniref:Lipoprotein n=1 Tax=Curtobacterium oceanosedimentum TaxID=465820 RepID=A0ABR5S8Z4_9MICO|nr:hypothetical protein [Curtobacterium oceanosedimentum]KTR41906.1 hypothetical protein NS263_03520 [Curtobacterium oceanosedimentum]
MSASASVDTDAYVRTTLGRSVRVGRSVCAAALVLLALADCAGTSTPTTTTVDPATPKQSIVDLVERSTAAVGGNWTVYRGPAVEPCGQDVEDRVRYVYIVGRAGAVTGLLQHDVDVVRAVWEDAGMNVVDTSSGGGSKPVGLRGTGDPVTSIGFDAKPDRSRISGVSVCAAGNATELRDGEFGDAG